LRFNKSYSSFGQFGPYFELIWANFAVNPVFFERFIAVPKKLRASHLDPLSWPRYATKMKILPRIALATE